MSTVNTPLKTFGGGSVLLARDPDNQKLWWGEGSGERGVSEVVCDLDEDLMNFWAVLADTEHWNCFVRRCQATPFSEFCWDDAERMLAARRMIGCSHWAWAFFVFCRQSLAGRMKSFAPISKTRTRQGMNEQASAWLSCVEGLPQVHKRLKRVLILKPRPAVDVIRKMDDEKTLFYLDPPYLHETRTTNDAYNHEMTREDHVELLDLLTVVKGKFILSGYHSNLYDDTAVMRGWRCEERQINNHAAGGKTKRIMTECLWMNF